MSARSRLHYAGGGRLWVVDPARGRVLEAPEEAGPILRVADRFRTLREHRRALLESGWQDDGSGSIDALLSSLVSAGILRSRGELLRRIQESAAEEAPPPIEAVTWITRDRPELLRRSVESAIANLRRFGRRAELQGVRRQRGRPGPAGHAGDARRAGPARGLRGVLRGRGGKARLCLRA